MHGNLTRRVLLGQLLPAALLAQSEDDPLRQLRTAHPRLILLDSDLERVRNLVRDQPTARKIHADLERECERLLTAAPPEYKPNGARMQPESRQFASQIATLAFLYRLNGREPYLRRAVTLLRAVAAFRDWNPTRFTETAELSFACALGYDWLYNALSPEERSAIRSAIVTKGLDPALAVYSQPGGWPKDRYNPTIICNSGMVASALAVAGEPGEAGQLIDEKSRSALRFALDSAPHGLATFGVEGSWPEGTDYWNYATLYTCLLSGALLTSLGNDYGFSSSHGVDRAGRFRIHMTGPSGRMFNFGDAVEDPGLAPQMFWFARRFANPVYAWSEQRMLDRAAKPEPWHLVWFAREGRPPQQTPGWPPDSIFRGVDIATLRSSWDDTNAIYIAVKGGDNKAAHAHLDLGSFVLDSGGVRWASDLGPDDYDLAGYNNGRQRWAYYRTRTESHNTLLIDGENQDPRAEARITRQEILSDVSWLNIDLSRAAMPGRIRQWNRRVGLFQRQTVLIDDTVRADQPVEVIWGMMTDAEITLSGQTATLRKGSWTLAAEIRTPRRAVFDIAPVHTPPSQAQNNGFRKLIVRLGDKVTDLDLSIQLTPYRDGQPRPKLTAQFPA